MLPQKKLVSNTELGYFALIKEDNAIFSYQSKDEEYIEMLIASEEEESKHRKQLTLEEEQREKNLKKKNKEALIDELVSS